MHYISMLKVTKVQTQQQQNNIESMLTIVIYKMKYDPSFNFDNEVSKIKIKNYLLFFLLSIHANLIYEFYFVRVKMRPCFWSIARV